VDTFSFGRPAQSICRALLSLVPSPKLSVAAALDIIDGSTPLVDIVVVVVAASVDDITTSVAEGWAALPESIGICLLCGKRGTSMDAVIVGLY